MTLDEIITALEQSIAKWGDRTVRFGFDGENVHSYRGLYTELAFAPATDVPLSSMLDGLKAARGKTFQGYKGGEYMMNGFVSVYIADYGEGDGDQIGTTLVQYWADEWRR